LKIVGNEENASCKQNHTADFIFTNPYLVSNPNSSGVDCSTCLKSIEFATGFYHCSDENCDADFHKDCYLED